MNIIDKIDAHLVKKEKWKKKSHYPSEINQCNRKIYWKWKGEDESNPISAGGLFKMKVGHSIHSILQEQLSDMGFDCIHEIGEKVKNIGLEHPVSYRVDTMFVNPETNMIEIIEVKSSYGNGIRAMKQTGAKQDDINQAILYMYLLNVDKCYLIYYARDDGYRLEYHITKDKDGLYYCDKKKIDVSPNELLSKFKYIEMCLESNVLPDREFKVAIKNGEIKDKFQKNKVICKSDWQCLYCQYKDSCWKDEVKKYLEGDNADELSDLQS